MKDRLLGIAGTVLGIANVLNWIAAAGFVIALALSVPFAPEVMGRLALKYTTQPVAPIMDSLRLMLVLGVLVAYPAHVILTRLGAIIGTAQTGDPFVAINARRLQAVGWALLAVQLVDIAFGIVTVSLAVRHVDTTGWSPSVGGWISVLMIFVLARVFAIGTRMRDDLEMTV